MCDLKVTRVGGKTVLESDEYAVDPDICEQAGCIIHPHMYVHETPVNIIPLSYC